MIRHAISPLLATRIFLIMPLLLFPGGVKPDGEDEDEYEEGDDENDEDDDDDREGADLQKDLIPPSCAGRTV